MLRYYATFQTRKFTLQNGWYDFLLGSTRLKRREAQLKEWEKKEIFQQLEDILVSL